MWSIITFKGLTHTRNACQAAMLSKPAVFACLKKSHQETELLEEGKKILTEIRGGGGHDQQGVPLSKMVNGLKKRKLASYACWS